MTRLFLIFCISFFVYGTLNCNAQYHIETIKKLTSPSFHGRGYYKKGDIKAAKFIRKEFKKTGLLPVNGNYFQEFSFPVNTFPGKMDVTIGDKKLVPGKDFIVSPACPSVKGTFNLIKLTVPLPDFSSRDYSNDFILIDKFGMDAASASTLDSLSRFPPKVKGVVIVEPKKLTWAVSQKVKDVVFISVLKDSFPESSTSITVNIQNKFIPSYLTYNVMGYVAGTTKPDSFIVFTAHHDHLGRMGEKALFAGANDNASGTAMIMDLARFYTKPENRPAKSVLFITFAAEEAGLVGSKYYTENSPLPLDKIRFLLNLDLMGNGDEGVMAVNGTIHDEEFSILDSINTHYQLLPVVGKRGTARNSDHYWFSHRGVPSFFLYTMGGSKAYHDIYDVAENLPLTEYEDIKKLLIAFVKEVGN